MNKTSNIGLGTAAIGRPLYINLKSKNTQSQFSLVEFKKKGVQVLNSAYDNGVRFFDTSPGYGISEELLIDWVKKKNDPSIIVSTKWGYTYVANFDPNAKVHEVKEHSINKLNEQWKQSKTLLPYLKIYQIHSATFDTGILENQEILKRLYELKESHNISIGLTTTGASQVDVLQSAIGIEVNGEKLFQSFQCTFNILDQSLLTFKEHFKNINGQVIIKEALANGRLIPNDRFKQYFKLYDYMSQLAKKYEVGVDAIALRFCSNIFPKAVILSGANNAIHLMANLKANQFSLSKDEMDILSSFSITSEDYWNERKELAWN